MLGSAAPAGFEEISEISSTMMFSIMASHDMPLVDQAVLWSVVPYQVVLFIYLLLQALELTTLQKYEFIFRNQLYSS